MNVPTIERTVGYLGDLNYLEIKITKNTSTSSIKLNNVELNNESLGSDGSDPRDSFTTEGATCWRVTGVDLTNGFKLTGTLALTGGFGGGDSSNVQIDVGYVIPSAPPLPSDTTGPVTSEVKVTDPVILNGYATVTATVDDTKTGGSKIKFAEYMLNNNGHWLLMAAKDGDFDEVSEVVEITFDALEVGLEVGKHKVCVRGTDDFNNVGNSTCQYFLVTYKFDGFFNPIDNYVLNVAKAGQAIPVKWRLTDANDTPIYDPASFVALRSGERNCTEYTTMSTDPVEESAGSSGLQYIGDGYWQFNWKTQKGYADKCYAMYVDFKSGATSPVVMVQFKK